MKLVVLEENTENTGDLSWAELAALGELTVYDRTSYVAVSYTHLTLPTKLEV